MVQGHHLLYQLEGHGYHGIGWVIQVFLSSIVLQQEIGLYTAGSAEDPWRARAEPLLAQVNFWLGKKDGVLAYTELAHH